MNKNISYMFLFFSLLFLIISIFIYNKNIDDISRTSSSDISFVLDVSQSMEVFDYVKDGRKYSRLDVAKDFIKSYIINNPQNRYSLTIFAGDGMEILPFTRDFNLFFTFLDPLYYNSVVRGGTNFFEGLELGINRFRGVEEKGGGIILLSDFELPEVSSNQKKSYLDKLSQIKPYLDEYDLKLYNIGFGNVEGGKIPIGTDTFGRQIFRTDSFGREVISVFDRNFFNDFNSKFNANGIIINSIDDISSGVRRIGDVPKKQLDVDISSKKSLSIYTIFISYILFLSYLFSYYFLRKRYNV